jgi:hypothetical protein
MSGQPYKYSTDIERFRNDYLNSLNLRAEIDKMNLDANVVYKKTGNLPPITQMADNRTTDEILADVEKLKRDLIGELAPIATPQFALQIISGIQASPLNSDGGLLNYFAQNITEFVTNLRKKYKYKIKGDQNDAVQFVLFVEDAYSKTRQLSGSVKTYFNRPLDQGVLGITVDDLNKVKSLMDEILIQYARGFSRGANAGITNAIITEIKEKLDAIRPNLDTSLRASYKTIINATPNLNLLNNQAILDSWQEYSNYLDALPTLNMLFTLGDQLKQASVNSKTDLSEQIAQNIYDLLPEINESRRINAMASANAPGPPPPPGQRGPGGGPGGGPRGPPPPIPPPPPGYSSSSTRPPISPSPSAYQSTKGKGFNLNFQNVHGPSNWNHVFNDSAYIEDVQEHVSEHEKRPLTDVKLIYAGKYLTSGYLNDKLSDSIIPPESTIYFELKQDQTQTPYRTQEDLLNKSQPPPLPPRNPTSYSSNYTSQPDTGYAMRPRPKPRSITAPTRSSTRYTGPDGSGFKRKKKFKDPSALISKMKSLMGNM